MRSVLSPEASYDLSDPHIFIPLAAGINGTTETTSAYWTCTLKYTDNNLTCQSAYHLQVSMYGIESPYSGDPRPYGYLIRPVYRE